MSTAELSVPDVAAKAGNRDVVPYIGALTGVRALAALYVLFLHLDMGIRAYSFGERVPFLQHGHLGVDLFFVLSGFVISHVYTDRMTRPSLRGFAHFVWLRFSRIWPVHVAVLAALIVLVAGARATGVMMNNPEVWPTSALPWHVLLIHGWGVTETATWNAPAWSISAEWFAYLLFPLMLALVLPVRRVATGLGFATLVLALQAVLFSANGWDLASAFNGVPAIARVTFEFLTGCLLYRVYLAVGRSTLAADFAGGVLLIGVVALGSVTTADLLMVPLLAFFILAVALSGGWLRDALNWRPVLYLGEISYSIYMVHFAFIIVFMRVIDWMPLDASRPAVALALFLGSIVVVCAIAAAAYHLIEVPARRRMRDWVAPAPVPAAEPSRAGASAPSG